MTLGNLSLFVLLFIFSGQEEVCHAMLPALEYRRGNLSKMLQVVNTVLNGWRGGDPRQREHKEEGWREIV